MFIFECSKISNCKLRYCNYYCNRNRYLNTSLHIISIIFTLYWNEKTRLSSRIKHMTWIFFSWLILIRNHADLKKVNAEIFESLTHFLKCIDVHHDCSFRCSISCSFCKTLVLISLIVVLSTEKEDLFSRSRHLKLMSSMMLTSKLFII